MRLPDDSIQTPDTVQVARDGARKLGVHNIIGSWSCRGEMVCSMPRGRTDSAAWAAFVAEVDAETPDTEQDSLANVPRAKQPAYVRALALDAKSEGDR